MHKLVSQVVKVFAVCYLNVPLTPSSHWRRGALWTWFAHAPDFWAKWHVDHSSSANHWRGLPLLDWWLWWRNLLGKFNTCRNYILIEVKLTPLSRRTRVKPPLTSQVSRNSNLFPWLPALISWPITLPSWILLCSSSTGWLTPESWISKLALCMMVLIRWHVRCPSHNGATLTV